MAFDIQPPSKQEDLTPNMTHNLLAIRQKGPNEQITEMLLHGFTDICRLMARVEVQLKILNAELKDN